MGTQASQVRAIFLGLSRLSGLSSLGPSEGAEVLPRAGARVGLVGSKMNRTGGGPSDFRGQACAEKVFGSSDGTEHWHWQWHCQSKPRSVSLRLPVEARDDEG